jgi:hypothetical protein
VKPATEILLSAAFALTPEENWTQNAIARTHDGHGADCDAPHAASWCVVGALIEAKRVVRDVDGSSYSVARRALMTACGDDYIYFNNTRTHAEVLEALYKAAEIAEERNG